jgi:phospholipid-transporting ATPase
VQVEWSEVAVGEVVKVESEELFPTDLILLASSADGGVAFIETASLDGEKNLKPRNAFPATQRYNSIA